MEAAGSTPDISLCPAGTERERSSAELEQPCHSVNLLLQVQVYQGKASHLILVIQDDTEDLGCISLLYASPSRDSEDIVVL